MMFAKLIVFFSFITLMPLSLSSKCITKHLFVGPYLTELPTNPLLLLLVDDEMEEFIQDSIEKYPIIMVSESDTVELVLTGRYPNEFASTQYIAKTDRSLLQGEKYHAEIFSRSDKHLNYGRRFHIIITPHRHEWLINDDINIEKPKFLSPPKKLYGTYTTPGCGPEVFDTYEIISNDNNYNLVEINVSRGDIELITYFSIQDNKIKVGKGMCFGGYVFKESEQYDVSFTLVNSNGDRSETMQMKNMTSPSWEVESEEFRMYMR